MNQNMLQRKEKVKKRKLISLQNSPKKAYVDTCPPNPKILIYILILMPQQERGKERRRVRTHRCTTSPQRSIDGA